MSATRALPEFPADTGSKPFGWMLAMLRQAMEEVMAGDSPPLQKANTLARLTGHLPLPDCNAILNCIESYGPIPALDGITPDALLARLGADKKTVHGKVHFVLPISIGEVKVVTDIDTALVREAIIAALEIQ